MHTHSKHTERKTLYKTDKDLGVQKSSLPSGAGFDVLWEQGCFISLFRSLEGFLPDHTVINAAGWPASPSAGFPTGRGKSP